ncbi:hypothetical protein IGI04_024179 [Brassica rapa subsp. trilocularis]|uniref:RNase H type-1 domain-containing protein n=1 Tax=Brassica rapa subsp. trilocularis TaxID=1813537 RepID=A0ABQ7M5Z9_BRACM|nr:hypothetical protein IGI04_024179 [Brassica rapa subsp. trilocularis]
MDRADCILSGSFICINQMIRVQSQQNRFAGLVAYLAEKLLVAQFIDMKIPGNISANLKACKG